jgi:hypothetical protein
MSPDEKTIYQQKAEEKLRKLKTRITALENNISKKEADIEVRFDQKMQQIRGQYAQTKEKLDAFREIGQNEWLELKADIEQALEILSEAVDSVTHHISAQPKE